LNWPRFAARPFFLPVASARQAKALTVVGKFATIVYAVQLAEAIWIVHAFQKKSKSGIATPKHEIDVVRERLKRLKEQLR
jgi:phage-related protein